MLSPDLLKLSTLLRGHAVELRRFALAAGDAASRSAALHAALDLEWRATCYERLVIPEASNAASLGLH